MARFALGTAVAGVLLMAVAPFQGGEAIMSNYVPVLDNPVFLTGLAVFAVGIFRMPTDSLSCMRNRPRSVTRRHGG